MAKSKSRKSVFIVLFIRILFVVLALNIVIGTVQIIADVKSQMQEEELIRQEILNRVESIIIDHNSLIPELEKPAFQELENAANEIKKASLKEDLAQVNLNEVLIMHNLDTSQFDYFLIKDYEIINSTNLFEIGNNFSNASPDFLKMLDDVHNKGGFRADHFGYELLTTKRLKFYAYDVTPDSEYLIYIHAYSGIADVVVDFFKRRLYNVKDENQRLLSINLWALSYPWLQEDEFISYDDPFLKRPLSKRSRVLKDSELKIDFIPTPFIIFPGIPDEWMITLVWDTSNIVKLPLIRNLKKHFLIIIIYIAIFSIILYLAGREFNLSLKELLKKTSIISKGNLNERVIVRGNNEFTTLSEQFNEMVGNLESSQNSLKQLNTEITDSINYAKRIQTAVLPSDETLNNLLPENFVLFKPKAVVSGDFYWIKQIKNFTIVVAADCTGHGVPGAFMSMLGVSMLNDIVGKSRLDSAGEFLDRLRQKVKSTLSQQGKELEQKDGMDLSLAILDSDNNEMQYAGAFNPVYIIRKKEKSERSELSDHLALESDQHQLFEIKGDRQPISIYSKEIEFKTNHIKLKKSDSLYMFSDGYPDQMGGPKGKKFMVRKFKELLLSIQDEPMIVQKEILDTTLEEWKKGVDQIDDILVFGIRW